MFQSSPILTTAGLNLLLRAVGGEQITFTRFKIGDGVVPSGTSPADLTDLVSVKLAFPIAGVDDTKPRYLTINGHFSSLDVAEDFRLRELGLFCKGEDNVEKLYCYINDGEEGAGTVKAAGCAVLTEQDVSIIVAVGNAPNVHVELEEGILYAKKVHTHSAADIVSGILPVERGGTGAATLAGLLAGMYDYREQTAITDLDTLTAPGLYYVDEGATGTAILPFTRSGNLAMDGWVFVAYTPYVGGLVLVHQFAVSDTIEAGLPVEILRRKACKADPAEIVTADWGSWE